MLLRNVFPEIFKINTININSIDNFFWETCACNVENVSVIIYLSKRGKLQALCKLENTAHLHLKRNLAWFDAKGQIKAQISDIGGPGSLPRRTLRRTEGKTTDRFYFTTLGGSLWIYFSLSRKELYCTYGSLSLEGGKLKRGNFQTVCGQVGLGRGQVMVETKSWKTQVVLYYVHSVIPLRASQLTEIQDQRKSKL